MTGPNDVLKVILLGLASLTGAATVALSSLAFRYRKKLLKAEKQRVELRRVLMARNRQRIESFETHTEDQREALTH